jgi:hypothetical protein
MPARRDRRPKYNTKPNTFIVGAPKAGTTSLHRYLKRHPDVSVSTPKEPYYFLETNTLFTAKEDYLDLWADTNAPIRVEASPTYLYEGNARQNIHNFNPNAKILIILREPTQLLHSLHQQRVNRYKEPITSFEDALAAEHDRVNDLLSSPTNLLYSPYVQFADHVQQYQNTFGQHNTKTILLHDLKHHPQTTYQTILNFLNLPQRHPPSFPQHNQGRTIKHATFHEFFFGQNKTVKQLARHILPWHIQSRLKVLFGRLTTEPDSSDVDEDLKNRLKRQLLPEVRRTSEILGRDLISLWGYSDVSPRSDGPLHTTPDSPLTKKD